MKTRILFFIVCLVAFRTAWAQTLNIAYKGIGDNREYFSEYNQSETILGSRLRADIGFSIDTIHHVRAGIDYFYEYGSDAGALAPDVILYYEVEKNSWAFRMGAIPIEEVLDYPMAIISDKYEYYTPTLAGLQVKYSKKDWHLNAWVDWVSRQDTFKREQFMAGLSGSARLGNFVAEEYWYMFHNAGTILRPEGEHIEDSNGGLLMVGYDFSSLVPLDILSLKTGILNSMWRSRGTGLGFQINNSSYTELKAEYKGYGVDATFNFGDQHQFAFGDLFYSNTTSYIRTSCYFTPINFERVKGRFTWSFHIANGDVDNQQQFSLVYYFDRKLW